MSEQIRSSPATSCALAPALSDSRANDGPLRAGLGLIAAGAGGIGVAVSFGAPEFGRTLGEPFWALTYAFASAIGGMFIHQIVRPVFTATGRGLEKLIDAYFSKAISQGTVPTTNE